MGSGTAVRFPGTLVLEGGTDFGTSIMLLRLSPTQGRPSYSNNWAESRNVFELDGPTPRLFKVKQRYGIKLWRQERDEAIDELTFDTLRKLLQTARSGTNLSTPNGTT